jgi:phosphoglycolate phosphatase-like HAD superfamily hydrolase
MRSPFRVAFDLDGTLADMHLVLSRLAARLFRNAAKPAPPPPDAPEEVPLVVARDDLHLERQQLRELWAHVEKQNNFWTTLPETENGIVARIESTARSRGWEVLFITSRPHTAGDPVQLQTQRWLRGHGFEHPSVCVFERSRGKLADILMLDAVVDDRPENCLDIAMDSKATPLLIWPGPETLPAELNRMGVRPFATIGEAVTWLEKLDDRRRQSGVMRTMRRLLQEE